MESSMLGIQRGEFTVTLDYEDCWTITATVYAIVESDTADTPGVITVEVRSADVTATIYGDEGEDLPTPPTWDWIDAFATKAAHDQINSDPSGWNAQ